ncbi:MAG: hypothetical protein IPP77_10720 [Bacteroidetes bacterium]|nr:hypothetical protein [Bacteroidota bacterium]
MLSSKDAVEIGLVDGIIGIEEMFELFTGEKDISIKNEFKLNEKWNSIQHFFEENSVSRLLSHQFIINGLKNEEAEKIFSTIKRKAPLAINVADKLIDEAAGCESELKHLREIFSSADALLGLTSIGKPVEYQGK